MQMYSIPWYSLQQQAISIKTSSILQFSLGFPSLRPADQHWRESKGIKIKINIHFLLFKHPLRKGRNKKTIYAKNILLAHDHVYNMQYSRFLPISGNGENSLSLPGFFFCLFLFFSLSLFTFRSSPHDATFLITRIFHNYRASKSVDRSFWTSLHS